MQHGYPRPQLQRDEWTSLNGVWEFAIDAQARWRTADQVQWDRTIHVPFAPEAQLSGVGETGLFRACWYRRTVDAPALAPGQRLVLHFGAVDYRATVWVNGAFVTAHEGGYTPFEADITAHAGNKLTIVVRAEDDPHDLQQPRGKQDWLLEPHSIWYPRTSGIWQTVWLERLPEQHLASLRWTASLTDWSLALEATVAGQQTDALRLQVRLSVGDVLLADDNYNVVNGEVDRRIMLSDPGIDDYRNELLWKPEQPTLIDASVRLVRADGTTVDQVRSYTALREVTIQGDRFLLNGRPLKLRMVLDQGYWTDGGLTAPDDAALRRDVELARQMGFNGVRKHQKIEDPRYLYWADRLGLMVWEEMPSAYRFTRSSVDRLVTEWKTVLERDASHPCIIAWVPFNESWGVPDLPARSEQRHYVQALYHLTKTIDPTRPVIGNDGWEAVATDIIGIHDYDDDLQDIAERYSSHDVIEKLITRERPGSRLIALPEYRYAGQPLMLTEFGGIAYSEDKERTWGYTRAHDVEQFAQEYEALLKVVRKVPIFAGFCYTQFADTYQESNGLLYEDRRPKFALERIALATRGPVSARTIQQRKEWAQRMQERYGIA